jgi:hypothetical protein
MACASAVGDAAAEPRSAPHQEHGEQEDPAKTLRPSTEATTKSTIDANWRTARLT